LIAAVVAGVIVMAKTTIKGLNQTLSNAKSPPHYSDGLF
jgi:hypothetical protein